jgi:hypothetical protein
MRGLVAVVGVCLAAAGPGICAAAATGIIEGLYPEGDSAAGGAFSRPCDIEIRYDDGIDETPGWAPALFWLDHELAYQALSVRFRPPENGEYLVERAAFYSPGWMDAGLVDVVAQEVGDTTNAAVETVWIGEAGTHEIDFTEPICVPSGGEFLILLCPHWRTAGLVGDCSSDLDYRSYYSLEDGVCEPELLDLDEDYMIWSCVRLCGTVPTRGTTWGWIKDAFRAP